MWQHSIEDAPLGRNSVICCTNAAGEPSSAIPQRYAGKSVLDIESPIQGLERRRSRWTDAALCISEVRRFGVEVVIVTGACAATEAYDVGISGSIYPAEPIREDQRREDYAVFAGVVPNGKFRLVKDFQRARHAAGDVWGRMPGPMHRQAPIGLPVATVTAATRRALSIASADRPKASFVPAACWNARHKPFSVPLIWVKSAAYSLIHSLPCGNV